MHGRVREIENNLQSQLGDTHQSRYVMPTLDVLEITAGVGNAVRAAVKQRGGRALVYNQVKDLEGTPGAADRLWKIIHFYEPKHVWVDVQTPWQHLAGQPSWPARRLVEIFLYQMENGRHFHINGGPSFCNSMPPEIMEIQEGTLQLRAGCARTRMRPHNIIHTTSRDMHSKLDERYPSNQPAEASGSGKHARTPRAPRNTQQPNTFVGQVASLLLEPGDVPF